MWCGEEGEKKSFGWGPVKNVLHKAVALKRTFLGWEEELIGFSNKFAINFWETAAVQKFLLLFVVQMGKSFKDFLPQKTKPAANEAIYIWAPFFS